MKIMYRIYDPQGEPVYKTTAVTSKAAWAAIGLLDGEACFGQNCRRIVERPVKCEDCVWQHDMSPDTGGPWCTVSSTAGEINPQHPDQCPSFHEKV